LKKKGTLKAVIGLSMILILAIALPLAGCAPKSTGKVYKIGEVMIIEHPDLLADQAGFHKAMAEEGFIEGENVEYIVLNAEGDMSTAKTIADRFVSEKVDLIHSIATQTSQACVAAAEGTIPIVFSTCTDPIGSDLVSTWDAPRPENVTGVSDMADIKVQMEMIREICPDFKVLGVIYNAGETNSIQQIKELKGVLSDVGIKSLVETNCSTTAEVVTAAKSLVGRCDVVWIPTDNTAVAGLPAIISVCEENKIPFFGSTVAMVEGGCIAARGASYPWIGYQAGKYAASILKGKSASDIPVVKCSGEAQVLVVNPAAAERMGITIPQSVIDKAAQVIE
jgi:putative ABC transport system substrate-binding protein